jgi:hypothetical protein
MKYEMTIKSLSNFITSRLDDHTLLFRHLVILGRGCILERSWSMRSVIKLNRFLGG